MKDVARGERRVFSVVKGEKGKGDLGERIELWSVYGLGWVGDKVMR